MVLLALAASTSGQALADGDLSRAAVRVSTHIAGQVTSLGVCADADPSAAAAYRAAASKYRQDADVAAASDGAQKILAEDARQAGRGAEQAALARQAAESAMAASLHNAAMANRNGFVAECHDELHDFDTHAGSFAPLNELFPYEMKLISSAPAAQ